MKVLDEKTKYLCNRLKQLAKNKADSDEALGMAVCTIQYPELTDILIEYIDDNPDADFKEVADYCFSLLPPIEIYD